MVSAVEGVVGSISLFFGIMLASAAGIGGGGLNVPILVVAFGFEFNKAVVLSLCAVLGNLVSQLTLNHNSHHPSAKSRPLPYWDLILCFLPAQLCGSTFGIAFRNIPPDTVLECIAMVVLIFAGTKTLIKGIGVFKAESQAKSQTDNTKLLNQQDFVDAEDFRVPRMESDDIVYPWEILKAICACWIVYVSIFLVLAFVKSCSTEYFVLLVIVFVPLTIQITWGIRHVQRKQIDYPDSRLEGDLDWSKNPLQGPAVAVLVGILSSLLGIGGGELMGPLLLYLKVLPQVAAGTTPIMSAFTTLSNVIQYGARGSIPLVYGVWVFFIGLSGGFIGRKSAVTLTKNYGRPSVTIFALAMVLYVGCTLLLYTVIDEGPEWESGGLC